MIIFSPIQSPVIIFTAAFCSNKQLLRFSFHREKYINPCVRIFFGLCLHMQPHLYAVYTGKGRIYYMSQAQVPEVRPLWLRRLQIILTAIRTPYHRCLGDHTSDNLTLALPKDPSRKLPFDIAGSHKESFRSCLLDNVLLHNL